MPQIRHIPKFIDVQSLRKYGNIHGTYEVPAINDVRQTITMMMMMTQDDDATAKLNIVSWQLGQISQKQDQA